MKICNEILPTPRGGEVPLAFLKTAGSELYEWGPPLTVASAFNGITRIADATGIPLDPNTERSTEDLRELLDINHLVKTKSSQVN